MDLAGGREEDEAEGTLCLRELFLRRGGERHRLPVPLRQDLRQQKMIGIARAFGFSDFCGRSGLRFRLSCARL